jgi:hypothetical protein
LPPPLLPRQHLRRRTHPFARLVFAIVRRLESGGGGGGGATSAQRGSAVAAGGVPAGRFSESVYAALDWSPVGRREGDGSGGGGGGDGNEDCGGGSSDVAAAAAAAEGPGAARRPSKAGAWDGPETVRAMEDRCASTSVPLAHPHPHHHSLSLSLSLSPPPIKTLRAMEE